MQGLILFAHGARDPQWAAPLRAVAAQVRQNAPGLPVELAFLEFLEPDLATAAARLVAAGVREVVIQPMFIARAGHVMRDVPAILAQLHERYPAVTFRLAGAIGENPAVIRAMALAAIVECAGTSASGD